MQINLNNKNEFTVDKLKELMASEDDSVNTQFRVSKDGILFISKDVGNQNIDDILFRLETNGMGNGYVGKTASENTLWVKRIYKVIKENWPNASSTYIDNY